MPRKKKVADEAEVEVVETEVEAEEPEVVEVEVVGEPVEIVWPEVGEPGLALVEKLAAAEHDGNEYILRPALEIDAAVETAFERLGFCHVRTSVVADVTVCKRQ